MNLADLLEARYEVTDSSPIIYIAIKKLLAKTEYIYLKCNVRASFAIGGKVQKLHVNGKLISISEGGGLRYVDWQSKSVRDVTKIIYPDLNTIDDELRIDKDPHDDAYMIENF
jgi:hypothetical protein